MNQVPTTIVTGFLGSGKTTIIGHLIDELQASDQQVIYIKNEIGDLDIDGQLMKTKQVVARELLNGCICCTLVGPFTAAISEVVGTYHPSRIIIEASGTADPAALALMVGSHPLLKREAVISIIDVVNFEGYQDLTVTAQQQTQFTDLIIFNKVELVDQNRKEAVVGYVRELNTHSPIIEAPGGRVPASLVFGVAHHEVRDLLAAHQAEQDQHSHHLIDDALEGFQISLDHPLSISQLSTWLESLPAAIFRVKGFVATPDGQHWLINRVAKRLTVEPVSPSLPSPPVVLVFIGYQAQKYQVQLTEQLHTL